MEAQTYNIHTREPDAEPPSVDETFSATYQTPFERAQDANESALEGVVYLGGRADPMQAVQFQFLTAQFAMLEAIYEQQERQTQLLQQIQQQTQPVANWPY